MNEVIDMFRFKKKTEKRTVKEAAHLAQEKILKLAKEMEQRRKDNERLIRKLKNGN